MKLIAKVLVVDKHGDVLVLRRSSSHPNYAHHWDFPGGEVEHGENPASAAAREIEEETGITIGPTMLDLGFDKRLSDQLTHMLFVTNLDSAKPSVATSWEHDTHKWLDINTLLAETMPDTADPYYKNVIAWLSSRPTS